MALLLTGGLFVIGVAVAVVVYRVLADKRRRNSKPDKVWGRVMGVNVELYGAGATAAGFILLAFLVYRGVIPEPQEVDVEVRIVPPQAGDSAMATLLRANAGRFALVLTSGSDELRISGFDFIENMGVLAKRERTLMNYLDKEYDVRTEPALSDGRIEPVRVILRRTTSLQFLPTDEDRSSWSVLLDIKSQMFGPDWKASTMRHIMVLEPDRVNAAQSLALNGYVGYGDVNGQTIWARSVAKPDVVSLLNSWSRPEIQKLDSAGIDDNLNKTVAQLAAAGDELGFASLVEDKLAAVPSRGGLSVDNTGPVIGPILKRTPGRDVLAVMVRLESTLDAESRKGREEHLGELFPFPAARAVFVVSTAGAVRFDPASVRTTYKRGSLAEVRASLGDAKMRKSERSIILDLEQLKSSDVARVTWRFR